MDMTTMAAAIKKLPEYTQTMTKLGQHVALAQQCMNAFSREQLMDLSQVEQTISTGVDEDGKEVKGAKLYQLVMDMLQTKNKEQKIRLLAIYYLSQKNVPGEDYVSQALSAARLNESDQKTVHNLSRMMKASIAETPIKEVEKKGGMFSSIFRGKVSE